MRKLSNEVTVEKAKSHPRYKWRVRYPDGGKRKDAWFKLKTDADEFAKGERGKIKERGVVEASTTKEERRALMHFRDAVEEMHGEKPTLTDAVDHYLKHLNTTKKSMTCQEVSDRLIDRLENEGKSRRHIDGTRNRLDRFNAEYGDRMAADISTDIIDDFLTGLGVAPKTMTNYRLALSGLFSHAVRMKAAPANPAAESMRPKVLKKEPGILKPKQVAALLAAADDRTLPALAISFFTGIRRAEIEKMDWSHIDFDEGMLEVKAPIAKKERRRFVDMSENLKQWLLPHAQHEGAVVQSPQIHRAGQERAREAAGLEEWPDNAGRHSFASYHLAQHQDAGKTAFMLGHPNPTLLYNTYRALVKPKDAHTYWSIAPEKLDNVTNIKAQ